MECGALWRSVRVDVQRLLCVLRMLHENTCDICDILGVGLCVCVALAGMLYGVRESTGLRACVQECRYVVPVELNDFNFHHLRL